MFELFENDWLEKGLRIAEIKPKKMISARYKLTCFYWQYFGAPSKLYHCYVKYLNCWESLDSKNWRNFKKLNFNNVLNISHLK